MDIETIYYSECYFDKVKIIINDEDNNDLWCQQSYDFDSTQVKKQSNNTGPLEGVKQTEDILDQVFTGKSIRVLFETDFSNQYGGFSFTVASESSTPTISPTPTVETTTSEPITTTIGTTQTYTTSEPTGPKRWHLTDQQNRIYVSSAVGRKVSCLQLEVTPEGYRQVKAANCGQFPSNPVQWRMFWTNDQTFQIKPIGVPGMESFCLGLSTIAPYQDDMLPCRYTDETSWSFDYLNNGYLYNPFYNICLVTVASGEGRITGENFKFVVDNGFSNILLKKLIIVPKLQKELRICYVTKYQRT